MKYAKKKKIKKKKIDHYTVSQMEVEYGVRSSFIDARMRRGFKPKFEEEGIVCTLATLVEK